MWSRRVSVALVLLSLACADKEFTGLQPKLEVKSPEVAANGHYLVDFGRVALGAQRQRAVVVTNIGRAPMAVQPVDAEAPFSASPKTTQQVAVQGTLQLLFLFTPTEAGVFTKTVELKTNGGNATLDFTGEGVSGPGPECAFELQPTEINFGSLNPGQTKTSTVQFVNKGDVPCELSGLQIDPSSDAVFALASGQATSATVAPGDPAFAISVTFAPTRAGNAFGGKATFVLGPQGTTVEVPLYASATNAVCSYKVAPTSLAFGSVVAGHPKTLSTTVTNTGSTDCTLSGLQLDSSSNPAYSLAQGQVLASTIAGGGSFTIQVVFNPTVGGTSMTGAATFQMGPPGTAVSVPFTGSSPFLCANPNPDGSCPTAPASVYLNTSSDLYLFNTGTHQASRIGAFHGPDGLFSMFDIAIDTHGQLVGVSSDKLYVIDPSSALCTRVGSVSNNANGLTFLSDGRLVTAGDNVQILDPVTYRVQTTLVPSGRYTSSGDIIGLPDGKLYWSVQDGSSDALIRIDPLNGTTTRMGSIGYSGVYALGYENGTLFGFNTGHYLIINQNNGQSSSGNLSGSWYGATTNPALWP